MGKLYKTSRAEVVPSQTMSFVIMQYVNPEIVFTQMLREYMVKSGFAEMYPNFSNVRIGAVHPFAMLLLQEVLGQDLNTNVFPSITISDSSDNDVDQELSRGFEEFILDEAAVVLMEGHKVAGELVCSDTNFNLLKAAVQNSNKVYAKKFDFRAQHSVDFNIWSDNKDITSLLYDYVKLFIVSHIAELHNRKLDCNGTVSGRRSGDINIEYAKMLYGANVTVPCTVQEAVMLVELGPEIISKVEVQQIDGEYHAGGL